MRAIPQIKNRLARAEAHAAALVPTPLKNEDALIRDLLSITSEDNLKHIQKLAMERCGDTKGLSLTAQFALIDPDWFQRMWETYPQLWEHYHVPPPKLD